MDLVPWKPFRDELSSLRQEMDKLWDHFAGETRLVRFFGDKWFPSADISEEDDRVIVTVELPGLEAKDVDVTISGDLLTIKGERKKEEEKKDEKRYRSERYYGAFQRVFQLPAGVETDKVEASFEKGVLRITIPKTEEARTKEIKVKVK